MILIKQHTTDVIAGTATEWATDTASHASANLVIATFVFAAVAIGIYLHRHRAQRIEKEIAELDEKLKQLATPLLVHVRAFSKNKSRSSLQAIEQLVLAHGDLFDDGVPKALLAVSDHLSSETDAPFKSRSLEKYAARLDTSLRERRARLRDGKEATRTSGSNDLAQGTPVE